ncbi:hypothetical protein [Pontibacter arcticus]|uniref:Lipoprotein n=1 Tax=Pontibacter arcticus TaxID=2080288 RepID=A0A364RDL0_9BACT|nr:hypothetical protein [Pontibacter arcticus]RAU82373.1 hypothetical protein DP923_11345 [Pontibacter arcticus]
MMLKTVFTILTVVLMAQCGDETATSQAQNADTPMQTNGQNFGQEVRVDHQNKATIGSGDAALTVTFQDLIDSRCPENVNCIQYGKAEVTLSATNQQGTNERIKLCLGDCQQGQAIRETDSVTTFVGQTKYTFTLKKVEPYPGTEQQDDTKKVRLVVEKL